MANTRLIMSNIKLPLTVLSPAKLNLFLHINGQLDNGYHELQSLFHFLDFGDKMTFTVADKNVEPNSTFKCDNPLLESSDNLILKAKNALIEAATKKHGFDKIKSLQAVNIELEKVLPMGGGVGGGSSNAATTLLALNLIWKLDFSLSELELIGFKLGADIPVFVRGQSAIAEGVGEKLTAYPIEEKWYLVLVPNQHVNTAELFSCTDLPRNTPKIQLDEIKYGGISPQFKNDFENLVYNRYANVAKSIDWLLEYGPARMTGTGACVFAEFSTQDEANEIYHRLPVDLNGFVAKGCNISPTHQTLFG